MPSITSETDNLKHVFGTWEPTFPKECQLSSGVLSLDQKWKKSGWFWLTSKVTAILLTELNVCERNTNSPVIRQQNSPISQSDQRLNGWIAYVKTTFYTVQDVESIYLTIKDNNVDLWLLIPRRDFKLIRRLIEEETKVLDNLVSPEGLPLNIEFHIMYRCGANESQFVPREAIRL